MFAYTQIRNADGDRVQDDVEECNKAGNPECKDEQDEEPNDGPDDFRHFVNSVEEIIICHWNQSDMTANIWSDTLIDFSIEKDIFCTQIRTKNSKSSN